MKPSELKKWMDKNDKKPVDVAAATHVSLKTVERFLAGKHEPYPVTIEAFKRLVSTEQS
jgi:hypothetical protein